MYIWNVIFSDGNTAYITTDISNKEHLLSRLQVKYEVKEIHFFAESIHVDSI